MFRKIVRKLLKSTGIYADLQMRSRNAISDYRNPRLNLGRLQATLNFDRRGPLTIPDVEFSVYSQFGDDGIIQFLVQKMDITNKTFIEFGVEDYKESNTRFLLLNNFWSGFVIDGSEDNIQALRNEQIYSFFDIKAVNKFIDASNINDILMDSGFKDEVGILSIDIDGNDYRVWESVEMNASIVICEYNALFGFEDEVTIPYDPSFVRGRKYPFNFYGASLAALNELAARKGYFFIGCNSAGNNAYFISCKLRDKCPFREVTVAAGYVFPSFSEIRGTDGAMLKGLEPMRSLHGLPLTDVVKNIPVNFDFERVCRSLKQSGKLRREF